MHITQCYISPSVSDFPFREAYGLTEYVDSERPCVFFGCYRREDLQAIRNHKGLAVIWWCGHDALTFKDWASLNSTNIVHITERKKVKTYMDWCCIDCTLSPVTSLGAKGEATILGSKIFAYMPSNAKKYHGFDLIDKLMHKGYNILVGDGSVPQEQWRNGVNDTYYSQCYMGLVLSPFAGGGVSIIEMGLRGIHVVTNVLDLPNTVGFTDLKSVEKAIHDYDNLVMQRNALLASKVNSALDSTNGFLNLSNYDY